MRVDIQCSEMKYQAHLYVLVGPMMLYIGALECLASVSSGLYAYTVHGHFSIISCGEHT
jgi:hypothetical protein